LLKAFLALLDIKLPVAKPLLLSTLLQKMQICLNKIGLFACCKFWAHPIYKWIQFNEHLRCQHPKCGWNKCTLYHCFISQSQAESRLGPTAFNKPESSWLQKQKVNLRLV